MLVSIYLEVDVLQSNQHCTFLALLVGTLQAEDVDQWEMWECQVAKYIDIDSKYIDTIGPDTSVNLAKCFKIYCHQWKS